jgi:hypothetical protein
LARSSTSMGRRPLVDRDPLLRPAFHLLRVVHERSAVRLGERRLEDRSGPQVAATHEIDLCGEQPHVCTFRDTPPSRSAALQDSRCRARSCRSRTTRLGSTSSVEPPASCCARPSAIRSRRTLRGRRVRPSRWVRFRSISLPFAFLNPHSPSSAAGVGSDSGQGFRHPRGPGWPRPIEMTSQTGETASRPGQPRNGTFHVERWPGEAPKRWAWVF